MEQIGLGGAVAVIVIGLCSLAISEAIRRKGAVADTYGGARMAPLYRYLMLLFGAFLVGLGVVALL